MLETLFGSKLRVKVLGRLFAHPDERCFVRQLAELINEDSTNVSRELTRLEKTGILVSTTEGKQKYYAANKESPFFNDLHGLILKATGADDTAFDLPARRFNIPEARLAEFCRKHYIRKLALFGSVLREDFRPDSDIDVLVEFQAGHVPGFAIIDIENELSQMVGRKVDLRTPNDLGRYFRDRVVKEARVQYAAAR